MRFDFLDLVQVKDHGHKRTHRGVVLQGNRSHVGDTYWIQWPDTVTIMPVEILEKFGTEKNTCVSRNRIVNTQA